MFKTRHKVHISISTLTLCSRLMHTGHDFSAVLCILSSYFVARTSTDFNTEQNFEKHHRTAKCYGASDEAGRSERNIRIAHLIACVPPTSESKFEIRTHFLTCDTLKHRRSKDWPRISPRKHRGFQLKIDRHPCLITPQPDGRDKLKPRRDQRSCNCNRKFPPPL